MNIANEILLPPGFRFHPTDQELIIHYLKKKVSSSRTPFPSIIADIDLYKFNPWELPGKAFSGESEWFFFSPRERKYPNGVRPNRAAASGYWKATGTDKPILASGGLQCLGVKKALVFYKGRPPKGTKTDWVMHEYRLLDSSSNSHHAAPQKPKGSMRLDDWVLCRVRKKTSIPSQIMTERQENFHTSPISIDDQYCTDKQLTRKREADCSEESSYQGAAYYMGPQEGILHDCANTSYQGPTRVSVPCVVSHGDDDDPQTQLVPSVHHMLKTIERSLSLGGLDDLVMSSPPTKRLNVCGSMGDQSPVDSASIASCFSEYSSPGMHWKH